MAQRPNAPQPPDKPRTFSAHSTLLFCVASADGHLRAPVEDDAVAFAFTDGGFIQERYQVQSVLGRGGMGCVYLANDHRLDRLVAIKVVADPLGVGKRSLEDALAKEARLGAGLNHPAIASVHDFGFYEGRAFTVFEYVDGDALRDIISARQRMDLDEVRPVIGTIAAALDFAHSRGIVHRDLKPENVRATKQGQFKILDLGLAQEFRRNQDWATFAGTPAYASPEQAAGLPFDGRTDQYALAVIAYELLIGRRPFEHEDPWELLRMHRHQQPPAPAEELPGNVAASIMRALEKDPSMRFASCEEFATALGAISHLDDRHRVVVDRVDDERTNLYICHAGDNSPMARQLSQSIEAHGYSCWHYEQDALPGISHVTQTTEAIKQCDAVVLMISNESINSQDVRREVQEAYHLGRPFLPVLLGLTRHEFQQRQLDWQPMIGSTALIDLTAGNLKSAVTRLVKTLQLWEVPPRPRPATRSSAEQSNPLREGVPPAYLADDSRKIWASDANQIEIYDLDAIVFRNQVVDDFLQRRNKFFLSASKGLGKTLLLTFKRSLLSSADQKQGKVDAQTGRILVPQGRPYLDFMSDVGSLSKQHDQLIANLLNTKRMWRLALNVSALSHYPAVITSSDQNELAVFPRRIRQWLEGAGVEPTVAFKELLGQSVREINRLIDETDNFLDHKVRKIHGGIFFFVDKVDQALRQLSRQAWITVQAGLIEAAWDLMNANSHIKVYASIRQEAFSNYESDIKANLFGATTMIRYSEPELHQMLDQLAQCYEASPTFHDFVTLNVVKHPRRPFPEDSFQYIRRHTLGRPRDLVVIASELSAKRSTINESQFCRLVNQTSATGLISNIFNEMRVFLSCLVNKRERQRFFTMIPYNILTRDEAIGICCLFNGLSADDVQFYRAHAEELHHPFCDLYRVGLLGTIEREAGGTRVLQKFKQPHDFVTEVDSALPDSPFYLLHPALDEHIGQLKAGDTYALFQHVAVGDGQPWHDYFDLFCSLERSLFPLHDAPIQDAAYRLVNEARVILSADRRVHLKSLLSASTDLALLRERCTEAAHDELNFLLEELLAYGDT